MCARLSFFTLLLICNPDSSFSYKVSGVSVHRVPLRQNDKHAPFCFAASSSIEVMDKGSISGSTPINFLASQVWPSARVAANVLEKHMDPSWVVCEFGCGPGLPSLAAAKLGATKVYATDLDEFALRLVEQASREQNLWDQVITKRFDLSDRSNIDQTNIPKADLYLFSDVFESSHVALGAAKVSQFILSNYKHSRIWVFAQSDRACREGYLKEMRKCLQSPDLAWIPLDQYETGEGTSRLFLCDLDETQVSYV